MIRSVFRAFLYFFAALFVGIFSLVVVPPLIAEPDIIGAFAAGFVNPYSSGYSADVFVCWAVLASWVLFEAKVHSVKRGWICLLLGIIPGVAVGFAAYLLIRQSQIIEARADPLDQNRIPRQKLPNQS